MLLAGLVLIVLALLGAPIFAVIAAGTMLNFARHDVSLKAVPIEIFGLAEMPILLAIPMFTFAGYLLSESRAPARLVRLATALIGWLPGGLALGCIGACAVFTAFTGASGVTIIALGALLYPALTQSGYRERFSLGLVTTAGGLGLLFAPSLPLILYGVIARVPIDELFLAGILPGLLMMAAMALYVLITARTSPQARRRLSAAELRQAAWDSLLDLPLPLVVLGGIYGGYFAVSEAAAVTAVYVFTTEVVIRRDIGWSRLPDIVRESMALVGGILVIVGVSLASTNAMIDAEVPQRLVGLVREYVSGPTSFMLILFVFLLVLGALVDIFSALVLVVPLILPVATEYGVSPVHLGIVFLASMELGYLMPPVGLNLFVSSYRFQRPVLQVIRAALPFQLALALSVLIIAFWPALSLALLRH
jgi:tripartite ATP-independent transporter DctM subunit